MWSRNFNGHIERKTKTSNTRKELSSQLIKLRKSRQKYMDMYADDLISREELNDKIGGMRQEIERLENEMKLVSFHITKGDQLESILNTTFKEIGDIADVRQMTNAQLKRIIQKIEVDKEGNVDIYLRVLGDLGLDSTVLINNDGTQRCLRTSEDHRPPALRGGQGNIGYQQGSKTHPRWHGHAAKISQKKRRGLSGRHRKEKKKTGGAGQTALSPPVCEKIGRVPTSRL